MVDPLREPVAPVVDSYVGEQGHHLRFEGAGDFQEEAAGDLLFADGRRAKSEYWSGRGGSGETMAVWGAGRKNRRKNRRKMQEVRPVLRLI